MKAEDFEKLQEIAEKDTKVPDTFEAIIRKNNILPTDLQKWSKLYSKQKYLVQSLTIDLDEKYGERFRHYKFDDNVSWSSTKEIETQIYSDPDYCSMLRELTAQKYYLQFIEETLNNLKGVNFIIKNYIEYRKLMSSSSV